MTGPAEGASDKMAGREPLRVAVIGAGEMGEAHLRAYAATAGVKVVAIVSRTPSRAAELAARYGVEETFSDARTMIDRLRPDGVSVTTAEPEHVEPACYALEHGIGVLLEKPMATTVEDATTIAEAARASGSILVPAHILRFAAPHRALKAEVSSGALGEVVAIAARRDRSRAIAEHYTRAHPAFLTLVHDIDLVLWLTGSRVTTVRALERRRADRPHPDAVFAHLELASGVVASVSTVMLHPREAPGTTSDRFEVYGTAGVASVDMTRAPLAIQRSSGADPDWLVGPADGSGAFGAEIGHFCDCLRSGRASDVVPVADAVAGVRVADAVVRSAADGGTVIQLEP